MTLSALPPAEVNPISHPGILSSVVSPAQSTHFRDQSSSHSFPSFPSTHKTNPTVFSLKQANKIPFSASYLLLSGLLGYQRCSLLQHHSKIIHRWVWPRIHYELGTDTENKRLEALIAFWWIENTATESNNKKQACILYHLIDLQYLCTQRGYSVTIWYMYTMCNDLIRIISISSNWFLHYFIKVSVCNKLKIYHAHCPRLLSVAEMKTNLGKQGFLPVPLAIPSREARTGTQSRNSRQELTQTPQRDTVCHDASSGLFSYLP